MARYCLHERDSFADGMIVAVGCVQPATVGPWCGEHAPKSDNARAPYTVDLGWGRSYAFSTFAAALEFYSVTLDKDPRLLGAGAEPSDENGEGGTDGLSEDERLLVEYAADGELHAAVPARRVADCAETVTAAPTAEALELAASMSGLRTTVACLGGALLGFAGGVL